jgi:hypothetical protein
MKNNYISIVGNQPISFDLHESIHLGPVIASSNSNKSIKFPYATCNSEPNLQDMLNSANFQGSNILVPEELFKKYVFFNEVTCLPQFPGLKTLEIDSINCTPQCLSLMLAVYLKPKIIFLLGYDLNNPIEFTRLKSIIISNPDTRFAYICNPRIKKLDALDNCFCDTYIKYQEVIDAKK